MQQSNRIARASLPALVRTTTPDRVAAALTEAIAAGAIAPGTQLVEVDLAREFGVSRHTVREAFRLLAHQGFVEHAPFRGVSVRSFTDADVEEVYRARRVLETHGAERAAAAAPDTRRALAAHAAAFDRAAREGRWADAFAADLDFHAGIVACLGSRRLDALMRDLLLSLHLAEVVLPDTDRAGFARSRSQHREILRALEARQPRAAKAAVLHHLDDSERGLLAVLREARPPAPGRNVRT